MSDNFNVNIGGRNLQIVQDPVLLEKLHGTGEIDDASYVASLAQIELNALKDKSNIDKPVQIEAPSAKAQKELENIGLEALLTFITADNRKAQLGSAENRIKNNKAEREQNFKDTMDKINEAIKEYEKKSTASWWQKAFGWVAAIATAIVAVAAICVGGVGLAIAGCVALYFAASEMTSLATGKGITEHLLLACKVKEDVAKWVAFGVDLAGGLISSIVCGVGVAKAMADVTKIGAKTALLVGKLTTITTGMQGASSVGSGISGGFAAYYTYKGKLADADKLQLRKALEKLLAEDQENQKLFKTILEFYKNMTDDISQIVKDKNQANMSIMSLNPGSSGMA